MSKQLGVLVACGSGIVTSTIVQEEIKKIADKNNIKITIVKGTISEVETKQDGVDVVFTTSNYKKELRKPHLNVFGLVSGINKNKNLEDIEKLLIELSHE